MNKILYKKRLKHFSIVVVLRVFGKSEFLYGRLIVKIYMSCVIGR